MTALAKSSILTEHLPSRRNGLNGGNSRLAHNVVFTRETVTSVRQETKGKGYEGKSCQSCTQFTLVWAGICLKCMS